MYTRRLREAMTSELLADAVSMIVYTVVAIVLTAGGLAAEYASVQQFGSGELVVAVWLAAIGCVMLYAGVYAIGYQTVFRKLLDSSHR